jgi:hypothetical protein
MHCCREGADDRHPCYCCRPVCRLDAPTPLLPSGFRPLLIGGGCLCGCRCLVERPATDRHVAGRGARRKIDEGDRRAPTRGSTLVVLPKRSGGKNHRISCRPRAGGGLQRGAALTGSARQRTPRRAAERRVGKTLPGTVAWLCGRDLAGFYWVSAETAHLFSC